MPVEIAVPGRTANVHQIEHGLLRDVLRRFLVAEVRSSRSAGACGRGVCGAVAALDSLLAAHPVDRRGRCRSCRDTGWLGRRRRVCSVFQNAHYWLRQPADRVQDHLAGELGMTLPPLSESDNPEAPEVLPRITDNFPTDRLQTPAVPPTSATQGGRPDRDHGGAGEHPTASGPAVLHSTTTRRASACQYRLLSGRRTEAPGAD